MSKGQTKDLLKFLKPFDRASKETALWLREFIWDSYPDANELIYDNYNALAFGWSPTDRVGHTFCSIAVGRSSGNVHFGFYWGSHIADPQGILLGEGNQYRYIIVKDKKSFPKSYIKKLMKEAYAYSLAKVKDKKQIMHGLTITKSISPVKRKSGSKRKKIGR
jgi:disulfide oxidoreductase YuzD